MNEANPPRSHGRPDLHAHYAAPGLHHVRPGHWVRALGHRALSVLAFGRLGGR